MPVDLEYSDAGGAAKLQAGNIQLRMLGSHANRTENMQKIFGHRKSIAKVVIKR